MPKQRMSVVVLTHNRRREVVQTLRELRLAADGARIIVVDNGSTDGSAEAIAHGVAGVELVLSAKNLGAAGRNLGVARVRTPYVAFCDDDTVWRRGSLARAADILDRHPNIAVVSPHITVGWRNAEDPACQLMEQSPLDSSGMPGKAVLGFMAGACVMRTSVFRELGGYMPRFFIGAEEMLLALDMAARGFKLVYCREIHSRHFPSQLRDSPSRRLLLARNLIWTAWMRLPWRDALAITANTLAAMRRDRTLIKGVWKTFSGIFWALRHRAVVPPHVQAMWAATHSR